MMKATGAGDCAVNRTPETRNGWEWTKDSSAERRQRFVAPQSDGCRKKPG